MASSQHFPPGCQNVDENGKAGKDYEGKVATTISGKECQKWSEHTPHKVNYPDVGDHNFCRNPGDGIYEGERVGTF